MGHTTQDALFWISPLRSYEVDVSFNLFGTASSFVWQWTLQPDPKFEVSNIVVTPGENSLKFTWTDPAMPDFTAIEVTSNSANGVSVSRGTETATLTGLVPDKTYDVEFRVKYPELTSQGVSASGKVLPSTFSGARTISLSNAVAVATGDLDGDGRQDLFAVTGYPSSYQLVAFLQGSAGLPNSPTVSIIADNTYTSQPGSIAVGDLDGDGVPEVAVGSDTSIAVYRWSQLGGFALWTTIQTKEGYGLQVVDLDGDGQSDLVGTGRSSKLVGIWYQNNKTLGTETTVAIPGPGQSIRVGDFNSDGRKDLAVGEFSSNSVYVILQTSSRSFSTSMTLTVDGLVSGIAAGHLTGDGKDDLAISYDGSVPKSKVAIFAQNSRALVSTPEVLDADGIPSGIAIGDMSGDGINDLVVRHRSSYEVGIFTQSGGKFDPEKLLKTTANQFDSCETVAVADFNNDGKNDIVSIGDYGLDVLLHN